MTGPRPLFSAEQAVARAIALVGRGIYDLGTGDVDTPDDGAYDCFGFAVCKIFGLRRHRPGFNLGAWATVEDDLNSNSLIEDAQHAGELAEVVYTPAPGVLLAYPMIRLVGYHDPWIGHIGIVVGVSRCTSWHQELPSYAQRDVVQCQGPNGRRPGIRASDGSVWDHHDALWPRPEHRTVMLRIKP